MGITALVMAGGKGTRMKLQEEKPLIKIGREHVVIRVIDALKNAQNVGEVWVATSHNTPKTAKLLRNHSVRVINTPGRGYINDLKFVVKKFGLSTVLAVSADLPLITGGFIDEILKRFNKSGRPALTVVVPSETKKKLGLGTEYAFKMEKGLVVPAGINIIDGRKIEEEMKQEVYILDRPEIAANMNTIDDLRVIENLLNKEVFKPRQQQSSTVESELASTIE
ncbi:NTP transferase domain-containing protein [Candidatus Bathyarchaeota archaeon]|nr:NTP transferase domain-containing protein [Candidatus Bathyarchaeota archaeon]